MEGGWLFQREIRHEQGVEGEADIVGCQERSDQQWECFDREQRKTAMWFATGKGGGSQTNE